MSSAKRILEYLRSIAPEGATNSQLSRQLGIFPYQAVFMATRELRLQGLIRGEQPDGRSWLFYATGSVAPARTRRRMRAYPLAGGTLTTDEFHELAQRVMEGRYRVDLAPGCLLPIPHAFPLVAADHTVVGDTQYSPPVRGGSSPSARLATISEQVWLLERTRAQEKFLAFGNDPELPRLWLERFGTLVVGVAFYFIADTGELTVLRDR